MKKFLLATVSTLALTTVTRAADIPAAMPAKGPIYAPVPVATWDGFYIGAQGGVAQNHAAFNDPNRFLPGGVPLPDHRKAGGTAGGFAGYNWQSGSFVYGLEGDWNWIRSKASRLDSNVDGDHDSLSISFDADWLATLRGRVGLAFGQALLYVTGGAAFGHVANSIELIGTGPDTGRFGSFAQNQTKVGWTAGVGAEYMLSPHWTARAEFRYVDLGTAGVSCTSATNFGGCLTSGPTGPERGEFSNTLKIGLVGVAYKF